MNLRSTIKLNNGVEIPRQALGVFQIPDGQTAQCVRWALEAGYRHIDTAAVYGNERGTGQGIKDSGIPRDQIFLTTKLWNDDMRKHRVREAFEESLEKLGTDYVDLYLIHWPVAEAFVESWKELEKLYREGRVRAIGVSNFHKYHMETLLKAAEIVPAVNQVELHPLLNQKPLSEYCRGLGIEMESYRPLGGTGATNLVGNPDIAVIAKKYGKSSAQIMVKWNLQSGNIVLVKSTHKERIIENADIYDFEISPEDMKYLDGLNQDLHTGPSPDSFDF